MLDIGSTAARLEVVDLDRARMPRVAWSFKAKTRLAEHTGADGVVSPDGIDRAVTAVRECVHTGVDRMPDSVVAFGTSAVRDAANGDQLRERLSEAAGVRIGVLSPHREAALTYHAARRWHGNDGTKMTTVDIGGGTIDVASGLGRYPNDVVSLPIGAARMTNLYLHDDPPSPRQVADMTEAIRAAIDLPMRGHRAAAPGNTVALSTVLRQLAVLTGSSGNRTVRHPDRLVSGSLAAWIPRLAESNRAQRAKLPGISRSRARRILAGAILAERILETLEIETLEICPWGLREGLVFRFVDAFDQDRNDAVLAAAAEMFA